MQPPKIRPIRLQADRWVAPSGEACIARREKSNTPLQALSLLERDYETELTASQVLDLSAMREALATGTDSKPFIKKPD